RGSPAALQHSREVMGERCQTARARERVLALRVPRSRCRKLAAEPEEGPSQLDQGSILQLGGLDALTIDPSTILGSEVPNAPVVLVPAELGVAPRHPPIRQRELQDLIAEDAGQSLSAASEPHAVDARELVAGGTYQRALAFHLQEQTWRKYRARRTLVALRESVPRHGHRP